MKNFIILASLFISVICYDYCNINPDHIACDNDGSLSDYCPPDTEIINLNDFQDFIVDLHNNYRNKIASGSIPNLDSATRMATMDWDYELAYLATLNVNTCVPETDSCCNTRRYASIGQNIYTWWGLPAIETENVIELAMESWFNEYETIDMSIIDEYEISEPDVGHFTLMNTDRNTRVGCAMIKMTTTKVLYTFTCDYSADNEYLTQVYFTGPPTSECDTGPNPDYPSLCSIFEDIDPNDLE